MTFEPVIQGVKIMVLGMGTVFSFLILMVGVLYIQAWVVNRWFPAPTSKPEMPGNDGSVVPAIIAAVQKHRKSRKP
jgi:oxaloacetate decarboxylase (Na+ extruding) subunit gamma